MLTLGVQCRRAFANFKAKVNRSHKFKSSDPRLKFLSKSLRDEIRVAVYKPMLRNIHIFKDAEERHLLPHKDPQIAYTTQLLRSIPVLHFTGSRLCTSVMLLNMIVTPHVLLPMAEGIHRCAGKHGAHNCLHASSPDSRQWRVRQLSVHCDPW